MNNDWLFKIVPIFIGFVFIVTIGIWIVIGLVGLKAVEKVDKQGLKSVISDVWNGRDKP